MKGVVLSRAPGAQIIDITHDIESRNVLAAAYVLSGAYDQFPPGTIHLAVVDPGVGSARRGIVRRTRRYYFGGPGNGLFAFVAPASADAFENQPSWHAAVVMCDRFL